MTDLYQLLQKKNSITIGRNPDCDIVLTDGNVSRLHCRVTVKGAGQYRVQDLASTNGVFVNGNKIVDAIVSATDVISIGNAQFSLMPPEQVPAGVKPGSEIFAIRLDNVEKTFDNGHVGLFPVSLKVKKGEFIAIMGPSGCGKSTLLKAINGENPATSGTVYLNDINFFEHYESLKYQIGYVPQEDIVHRELTVQNSLYYACKLRFATDITDTEIEEKVSKVLTALNINTPDVRQNLVGKLSGGQRKRVSIAMELLTEPNFLFLDEPTSPLDPETIEDFLNCLKQLAAQGTTILMVTHKPDDLHYADKVLFLSKGGYICYYGSTEKYLSYFGKITTIEVYSLLKTAKQGLIWYNKWNGDNPPSSVRRPVQKPTSTRKDPFFKQLLWLTIRYFNIKTNDRTNTLILLAQAPIIALLICFIFKELTLAVLFLITIAAVWFGTSNATREIVGELPIYNRERMFNLQVLPYILSKIIVLTTFAALQSLLFIGILYFKFDGGDVSLSGHYTAYATFMLYLSFSATLIGLFLSTIVNTTEKAMTLLPIVLMPQIMLAGIIASIEKNNLTEYVSTFILARWGTEGFALMQRDVMHYLPQPTTEDPEMMGYQVKSALKMLNLPNTINRFFGLDEGSIGSYYLVIGLLNVVIFTLLIFFLRKKDAVK
jgi:ABC-type multidrug transport system ATPase subunit